MGIAVMSIIPAVAVFIEEFGDRDLVLVGFEELDFNIVVRSQFVLILHPFVDGFAVKEEVRDCKLKELSH